METKKQNHDAQQLEEGGNRQLLFNGLIEFQFGEKNFLELDGGDGCTILQMYSTPLNCTLENG